jgi:hypothetical protein
MSKLYVDAVEPEGASTVLTLGASGDTVDIPTGATIDATGATITGWPAAASNTPAFLAVLSANRTITDLATVNAECNTELLDTDGLYDNSTNYRFTVTPTTLGWYWISGSAEVAYGAANAAYLRVMLYRNGVEYYTTYHNLPSSQTTYGLTASGIVDLTTDGDYVELFLRADDTVGNPQLNGKGSNTFVGTYFNGYKLAGVT